MEEHKLHAVRFVSYNFQAIQCLSFSSDGCRLALSRKDGSIEVWSVRQGIFTKIIWIPGRTNTSIEAIQWCNQRLFTGCLSGSLEEWDLLRLCPLQSIDICGCPIWCLQVNNEKSLIAIGCENGQIHLWDLRNNAINFVCFFHVLDCRIISLAWHPKDIYVVIGGSGGVIKKVEVNSGKCVLEIFQNLVPKPIIWDLQYIESYIISADSNGTVIIWNDSFGTVLQSFKEHGADVLALAIGSKDSTIYSSGIDQKIVCFKKLTDSHEWIKHKEIKIHSHDVRALDISFNGFLASGGVDTHLFITDIRSFSSAKYLQLQDSSSFFKVASKVNAIMYQSNSSLQLWKLSSESNMMPVNFLEIKSKGTHYILCSAISSDGTKVALSSVKCLWIYDIAGPRVNCVFFSLIPCYKLSFYCEDSLLILATINEGLKVFSMLNNQFVHFKSDFSHLHITDFICSNEGSHIIIKNKLEQSFVFDIGEGSIVCKFPDINCFPKCLLSLSSDELLICTHDYFLSYNILSSRFCKHSLKFAKHSFPTSFCLIKDKIAVFFEKYIKIVSIVDGTMISTEKDKECLLDGDVLFVASFSNGELIVVQQSFCESLNKLPQVLFRDHYGT